MRTSKAAFVASHDVVRLRGTHVERGRARQRSLDRIALWLAAAVSLAAYCLAAWYLVGVP